MMFCLNCGQLFALRADMPSDGESGECACGASYVVHRDVRDLSVSVTLPDPDDKDS